MTKEYAKIDILCEYEEEPIGIDIPCPRFSWKMKSDRHILQNSYRIIVADTKEAAEGGGPAMWDSGRVYSTISANVAYGGKTLSSRERYFWKLNVWTEEGSVIASKTGVFEMGLLEETDWKATWMGNPASKCGSSLLFRRMFLIDRKVWKARAYICGLGLYELRMNGEKVGDHVLDPAWTEYQKRVFYVTYDITDHIIPGNNVIGIFMGNGWHGSCALLCQIEITFEDGEMEIIYPGCHTSHWLVSAGPVTYNSIYDGERYDARLEKEGWDKPEYDCGTKYAQGYGWTAPSHIAGPAGKREAQRIPPIKKIQEITPKKIILRSEGIYVVDMGQNMAGWVRLNVSGKEGTEISMRYAEVLYEDGSVNQENLRTAEARDVYILKGDREEEYEPRFTYHGFRYVQIEGFPGELTEKNISGCVVRTAVDRIGYFKCSDTLLNQIYSNVLWTESGNLHGVPTDCPQRDERHGWLNDMTVRGEESAYNFDMSRFLPKWIQDIKDTQDRSGAISDTAPFKWGHRPADPVSSCYLIIPWLMYMQYGDKRVLEENYEGMKMWETYLETRAEDHIISDSYYGDWAGPVSESIGESLGDGAVSGITSGALMSTGFFYLNAVLLQKMAKLLGLQKDAEYYANKASKIKQAFHNRFFDSEKGTYGKGSQTANAFALFLGVVPGACRERVLQHLLADIKERKYHLSTGNLGTKYVMEVLAEYGAVDTAMGLLRQTTYPSWGYMIANGATTIWERWEYAAGTEMNSHNHPMLASVGSWFYKYLAGIRLCETEPAFQTCVIRPCIPSDLDWMEASLNTIKGKIAVSWKKNAHVIDMDILIPCSSSAQIQISRICAGRKVHLIHVNQRCLWENGKQRETLPEIHIKEDKESIILNTIGCNFKIKIKLLQQK